ncbi:MAG TPA: methyltransferase domain-containing protein [Caulobacteraceae bacterium]|jgi:SAM-dependent methyltransferase|nr:methyltransferase domain-containing protein [Caulobacteraceae bacterium]
MARDFSRRSAEAELMDADDTPYETFRGCLRDLAQVNVVTLAHGPTLAFLERLRKAGRLDLGRPVGIVDAGAGYGDMLRAVGRWAARRNVPVRLTGVDLNPWSAKAAAEIDPASPIRWLTGDVFAYDEPCDLVVSSLFTHHLTDDQLVRFLTWMERTAAVGWFVNDLHRHPFPFYGFRLLAAAMRWHPFVRHDGPVSIARAFSAADWRSLIDRAGLSPAGVKVRWRFPFRLCVARLKPR